MFDNFNAGMLIVIVLAVIIGIYLHRLDKKEKSDPLAALCNRYCTLSTETLATISDSDVVRAVAANIMAKTDRRRPDVYNLIPLLSHGQVAVYSVWLVCHELETADMDALLHSSSGRFVEPAADGFSLIGADRCAAALLEPQDEPTLRDAIVAEQPLSLCVAYIRDNPDEFIDL